jgi:2-dehydro-3-deoxyphosphogluconate aldolase/(4S)-4-hydroxy-2-oxoglutarate aldolase
LFTHEDVNLVKSVIDALYAGGTRVFEFTNRRKNSLVVFKELIHYIEKYPDFILGIGTVMDAEDTQTFIESGAQFIVSPILQPAMGEVCKRHGTPWIPGCATLTEMVNARNSGAQLIKVFPGSLLGPGFVSSVLPVVPDLHLMISGGVEPNEKSLSAWFGAGAVCVGLGSQLFTKEIIDRHDWKKLSQSVADCLAIIERVRK